MLPQPLIEQYWHEVEDEVVTEYQHPRPKVTDAIGEYRRRLAGHGVGDILYHADVKDTAAVIDAGIRNGFPEPEPMRS